MTSLSAGESLAWSERDAQLADIAMERFANRTDIWGSYNAIGSREKWGSARTAPAKRDRGRVVLTVPVLARHFRGASPEHILGVHAISAADSCKWLAIDFDQHRRERVESTAHSNWDAALRAAKVLGELGLFCVLEDSNGNGGFHLWCFFAQPLPSAEVFQFARRLIEQADLPPETESFPKQSGIKSGFGNWLRLPGRHHDGRSHWSRFWSGDEWLRGKEAVSYLIDAN